MGDFAPVDLPRSKKLNFASKDESTNRGGQSWKGRYYEHNRVLQNMTKEHHSVQAPNQKEHPDRGDDGVKCGVPLSKISRIVDESIRRDNKGILSVKGNVTPAIESNFYCGGPNPASSYGGNHLPESEGTLRIFRSDSM